MYLFGCLGENVMMMTITMMKCFFFKSKCMHRNAIHLMEFSSSRAIVKSTRYLDRSLFDWNQNQMRCFAFFFVSIFTALFNNKHEMLLNCRNIFRHTFTRNLYSRKRQCFSGIFLFQSDRVRMFGSMLFDGLLKFLRLQLHAFHSLSFFYTLQMG